MQLDDNKIRAGWKMGASCQIYSNSKKKWFYGEVAQIFTDEEGEWLEVRYDKSMSKQVQRYSTDIRPDPKDLEKPKKTKSPRKGSKQSTIDDQNMQIRTSWGKGDQVEIFSNTHQEWYLGEVVDIIKDDEGEWLNCVWARTNGEAMSKQVQRFSTDVRPVQDDDDADTASDEVTDSAAGNARSSASPRSSSGSPKNKSKKSKAQQLADMLKQRNENFRRRAPPFSRTLRPSTFTYPATSSARRQRKLLDLEETNEKNQHVVDSMPRPNATAKRLDLTSMKPRQVQDFIRALGSAYERYVTKFRRVRGPELVKLSEAQMQKLIPLKLHRNRVLMEIARHTLDSPVFAALAESDIEVLKWTSAQVSTWLGKQQVTALYATKFANHGVDGLLLFELDNKDLSTIGVNKKHQTRVLDIIAHFAQQQFPTDADDEKDAEANGDAKGMKRRVSVANVDLAQLNGGIAAGAGQNNDAIIYTMGQLLLELGQMFKGDKVQELTTTLKRQLAELQSNSQHPGLGSVDRGTSVELAGLGIEVREPGGGGGEDDGKLVLKMQDRADSSPTGVNAAWINTQMNHKGHARRSSLPYINTNQLEQDDVEDEEEDISDIE